MFEDAATLLPGFIGNYCIDFSRFLPINIASQQQTKHLSEVNWIRENRVSRAFDAVFKLCLENANSILGHIPWKTCMQNLFLVGCIRGVAGEGMPIYKRSTTNGNLYIRFNVIFPEKNFLDEEKLKVSWTKMVSHVASSNK